MVEFEVAEHTHTPTAYKLQILRGYGASRQDDTFVRTAPRRGYHRCCGSKAHWRHKRGCVNTLTDE